MFLHFAKLWNWEISAAGNWYCPLSFCILPSYETGKSVQQMIDTVPYVSTFLPRYETEKSVQRITDTVPYVSTFCQVMKLEISAADNWYCPLCFYVLPKYETGKSVQQILILSLTFLHFAKFWHWKSVQQVTDTVPYVSTFCQVMKLGNQCSR